MRVFAVAQRVDPVKGEREARRRHGRLDRAVEVPIRRAELPQRSGNRRIVGGRVRERLAGEVEAELQRRSVRTLELCERMRIISRIDDDEHVLEVLRGRPHHAGPADVDFLDQRAERDLGPGRRFHKGIQIHDDDVDRSDPVLAQRLHVVGPAAACEDAAVNRRVKGFDPSVHDFRKARHGRDAGHGHAGLFEGARRAACRHELPTTGGERLSKRNETGLV